jgi:hypothetical protein
MGKRAKEHRKKVQARNARLKSESNRQKKIFEKAMEEQIELMKSKMSGETKEESTISLNTDGFIQSSNIL